MYSNYKFQGSDCDNGIQDGTETGVDCGGTCTPCATVDFSCNQANNTINFNGTNATTMSTNMSYGEVTIHPLTGGTLFLDFGDTDPTTGIYQGTGASGGNGYVWMYYVPFGSGNMYQSYFETGNVQVTVTGSTINIEGCNLRLSTNSGITYVELNLNVNCN